MCELFAARILLEVLAPDDAHPCVFITWDFGVHQILIDAYLDGLTRSEHGREVINFRSVARNILGTSQPKRNIVIKLSTWWWRIG